MADTVLNVCESYQLSGKKLFAQMSGNFVKLNLGATNMIILRLNCWKYILKGQEGKVFLT